MYVCMYVCIDDNNMFNDNIITNNKCICLFYFILGAPFEYDYLTDPFKPERRPLAQS